VQQCSISTDDLVTVDQIARRGERILWRQRALFNHSSIDDDAVKSASMRCVGLVGLEDHPNWVSGFVVEPSDCGSGAGTQVSQSVPLVSRRCR